MEKLLLPVLAFFLLSCGGGGSPVLLDLDAAYASRGALSLGKVAGSLEYVPLEIPPGVDSGWFPCSILVNGGYILQVPYNGKDAPLMFDMKGRFLFRIGTSGNDPALPEGLVTGFHVDARDGRVTLFGNRQVAWFGADGVFLGKDSVRFPGPEPRYGYSYDIGGTGRQAFIFRQNVDSTFVYRAVPGTFATPCPYPGFYGTQAAVHNSPEGTLSAVYSPCLCFCPGYALYYDRLNDLCYRFYENGRVETAYRFLCSRRTRFGYKGHMYDIMESDDFLFGTFVTDRESAVRFVYFRHDDRLYCLPEGVKGFDDDLNGTGIFWPDGITADGRLYAVHAASALRKRLICSGNPAMHSVAAGFEKAEWAVVFADPLPRRRLSGPSGGGDE